MAFHPGRGCPRGRPPPGLHGSAQSYRPPNLRPPPPHPPAPPYHYDQSGSGFSTQGSSGYMAPRADFIPYPLPVPSQASGPLGQCPFRPPFPNPPLRQGFPEPPNFPPPPLPNSSVSPMASSTAPTPNAYPYMMAL